MKYRYLLYIMIIGLLFSCKPELDEYAYDSGSADFSTYVSLGNSLTAGYMNGSLYRTSQLNSFPSILAGQFAKMGGGAFEQPLMEGEYGIIAGKLKLGYSTDCLGATSLGPVPDDGALDPIASIGKMVNNMGVPGAKSGHLLFPGYAQFNPYFARFASDPNATVVGDAMAMNPTFFTLWIGNNDVLGYGTSGGVGDTITSQTWFAGYVQTIVETLTSAGAKGAIANIPDITNVPFFTTVPPNGLVLNQEQAAALNAALGSLGFQFAEGPNYFIIQDASSQIGFRQMVEGELLLLTVPQDALKCEYMGAVNPNTGAPNPIPQQYVLTLDQIDQIENAITGYNATISAIATNFNLAFVDFNAILKEVEEGIIADGETLTTEFVTGNAFSLDGIHLTAKGYAYVANEFIKAINMKYGSNVPMVSITNYEALELP
ncbi:MAG: hypothetical protein KDC05_13905 [Bacteroidales bacterium]|nr:hypothetical protein [Bacteroidales bacterium]